MGRSPGLLRNLPGKRAIFAILMAAALVMMVQPATFTGPLERVCQAFFAPAGRAMVLAGRTVRKNLLTGKGTERADDDSDRQRGLENALAAMGQQLTDLRKENKDLTQLRSSTRLTGKLIPSRVVGYDSVGRRESIEVDRGSSSGVAQGQPAVAGVVDDLLVGGRLANEVLLASGCLIGKVEFSPGPYTCRIRLLSDPNMRILAKVGRIIEGQFHQLAELVLVGKGKGKMVSVEVAADSGIEPGDLVISAAGQLNLPCSLVVGTVAEVCVRTDNRQLQDLIILPRIDKRELDKVYLVAVK